MPDLPGQNVPVVFNGFFVSSDQDAVLLMMAAPLGEAFGVAADDAYARLTSAVRGEPEGAELFGFRLHNNSLPELREAMSQDEQKAVRFDALLRQYAALQELSA